MNPTDFGARFTRRAFLAGSATTAASLLFAQELFGEPDLKATKPTRLSKNSAPSRWPRRRSRAPAIAISASIGIAISSRLPPFAAARGTATDEVPFVNDRQSFGFGVRVIVKGQWGFAASPIVTTAEIARITREAVTVAKANLALQAAPVKLAPTKAYVDRWTVPHEKDPFSVSVDEKLELIHNAALTVKKNPKVMSAFGRWVSTRKTNTSRRARVLDPAVHRAGVSESERHCGRFRKGVSRSRSYEVAPMARGWEYVPMVNLGENAKRIAEEVVEHLSAPPVSAGKKDLVLLPSHCA
jgi:TldD protein